MPRTSEQTAPPPALAVLEALVNSDEMEDGTDELGTVEGLAQRLRAAGLLEPDVRPSEADRRRAIELRHALRVLLLEHHDGEAGEDGTAALAELEQAGRDAGLQVRFGPAGAALEPSVGGVAGALGRVVAAVFGAMADGTWPRLKACRNAECLWVFYDQSRNHSRAWCDMASCGSKMKMRAYRERERRRRN